VNRLTAIAAYAGGSAPASGRLCYDNYNKTDQYVDFGAAEVVSIELDNEKQLEAAASVFFGTFVELAPGVWARPDAFDVGAQCTPRPATHATFARRHGPSRRA
jgi:hypothetical protein